MNPADQKFYELFGESDVVNHKFDLPIDTTNPKLALALSNVIREKIAPFFEHLPHEFFVRVGLFDDPQNQIYDYNFTIPEQNEHNRQGIAVPLAFDELKQNPKSLLTVVKKGLDKAHETGQLSPVDLQAVKAELDTIDLHPIVNDPSLRPCGIFKGLVFDMNT